MNKLTCWVASALFGILISILSFLGTHAYNDLDMLKAAVKELQVRAEYTSGKLPAAPIKTKIDP